MTKHWTTVLKAGKSLVLFDGVCNLCNGIVQFLLKRDPGERFVFASLQSATGQSILEHFHLPASEMKSLVLIEKDQVYLRSDAALQIARRLNGLWPLLYAGWIIPRPVRHRIYDWIATNRYRWFGQSEQCLLPKPEWKERFLEV